MDDNRFDDLTRAFVAPSRRGILTAAGAATVAAMLGRAAPDAARAARRNRKKDRKKKKHPPRAAPPPPPAGCPAGTKLCGGQCIPASDCCGASLRDGGTRVPNGATFGDCGTCVSGTLQNNGNCEKLDPDGCHACKEEEGFHCEPGNDGKPCTLGCGVCNGGLCDQHPECPGSFFGCCEPEEACCPGSVSHSLGCCPPEKDCCFVLGYGRKECVAPVSSCGTCQWPCVTLCCDWDKHVACCATADGKSLYCSGTPCPAE